MISAEGICKFIEQQSGGEACTGDKNEVRGRRRASEAGVLKENY